MIFVPGKNQSSVTVPKAMYDEVRRLVSKDPALYDSISDFVHGAIREEIRRARTSPR